MAEQPIIRTQDIVVGDIGQNNYGDLTFADQEGNQYKISSKRKQYFEKVIVRGNAIQLNYAMSSFGKEYIYSAKSIEGETPIKTELPQETPKLIIAPQEKGMWYKEVGENFRAKLFNKDDNGAGSYLWRAYIKQMLASLEITIPTAKSKVVEEAKKMGAKEIGKEV